MTSPPLPFFLNTSFTPESEEIEAKHDAGFMVHLIASKRR